MSDLCVMQVVRFKGHSHLALNVIGELWVMISCSQISGQMSFRHEEARYYRTMSIEDCLNKNGEPLGISHEGHLVRISKEQSQDDLASKTAEAMKLLGKTDMQKPFVSISQRLPLVTDGSVGFEVHQREHSVTFYPENKPKCYRVLHDPMKLNYAGDVLTPLEEIMNRIKKEFSLFADPFSTKNTGVKKANEVKTIGADRRIQMRKRNFRK